MQYGNTFKTYATYVKVILFWDVKQHGRYVRFMFKLQFDVDN